MITEALLLSVTSSTRELVLFPRSFTVGLGNRLRRQNRVVLVVPSRLVEVLLDASYCLDLKEVLFFFLIS